MTKTDEPASVKANEAQDLNEISATAEKIVALENQIQLLSEQVDGAEAAKVRALADLQNFQRRQSEDRLKWSDMAVTEFLKKVLPNFLELKLGGDHAEDETIKAVIDKFFANLEKQGLKKIAPEPGQPIDPEQHEVLMMAEGEAGTVVQCLEPGWQYGVIVITPAKVSGATE